MDPLAVEQTIAARLRVGETDDDQGPAGRQVLAQPGEGIAERMWWIAATQVMTSCEPGGITRSAPAAVKVTGTADGVSSRARVTIAGSTSTPWTSLAREARSLARSPLPHPTFSALPKLLGSCRRIHGW
ncbi:hypothetical protein Pmi06nite_81790 [Planotetraspora mira]|uniref:Uncharacterized protein n=1 Tax=Planotetraspora mira TaxID=58121 RepID=A0A8J3U0M4_9ACTN|nr:hypothetical protein Pmi06nite_81790 [Planotetraspora mira]